MSTEQIAKRKRRRSEKNPASYDEETVEFIKAVDVYRSKSGRSFPPWSEVLDLLRALGYRRVASTHATIDEAVIMALAGEAQEAMEEVSPMEECD